jgi:integrase/recombinase XerD
MPVVIVDTPPTTKLLPAWIVAPEAPLQPSIGIDDRDDEAVKDQVWPIAYEQWLASCSKTNSQNTLGGYKQAIKSFFKYTGGIRPWRVMSSHVIGWQNEMRSRGLKDSTINLRLSGLSSLFNFLGTLFPYPDPRTRKEAFLVSRNPVDSAKRAKVDPYANAGALSVEETTALLRKIDRSTVIGLRDFALIHTLIYTGCRIHEILRLRWGDITENNGHFFYAWQGKGGKGGKSDDIGAGFKFELPGVSYLAIHGYLKAAGKLEMAPDQYIFVAHSDAALHLPNVKSVGQNKPLSTASAGRLLRRWAAKAGLDPKRIHPHLLRHTAGGFIAMKSGDNLKAVQEFLHHSNPATTQIYLSHLKNNLNPYWMAIEQMLGL